MADTNIVTRTNIKEDDNVERDAASHTGHSAETEFEFHANEIRAAIMGNIILVGFAFLLTFLAFYGIANLQSSLNNQDSLGTIALCCHFSASALSSIFLATYIIRILGCKWTICITLATYIPYIASQFYVTAYTIIPTAIFCGIGSGPLWVASSTYLVILTKTYSNLIHRPLGIVVWHFSGIFYVILVCSQILGNTLSSLELLGGMVNETTPANATLFCGATYCPEKRNYSYAIKARPKKMNINMLITIYITCIAGAIITVFFFVDSLSRRKQTKKPLRRQRFKLMLATAELLTKREQLVLVPITIFVGCSQAFVTADFNKAFIACSWGIHKIGFVMACYGAMKGLSMLISSLLVKQESRFPIFSSACILHITLLVILLFWAPTLTDIHYHFIVSSVLGLCNGAWIIGINAMYGILIPYNLELEYNNYRFWETVGQALGFGYSPWLCLRVKVYILIGVLVVGMAGYIDSEIRIKKLNKEDISSHIQTGTSTHNNPSPDSPVFINEEKDAVQPVNPI